MSCCRIDRSKNTNPIVLGYSKDEKIAYYVLAENRCEEAVDVLTEGFFQYEPISTLLGVSKSAEAVNELNLLATDMAKDNISLIAVDLATNSVVGVCFNKMQEMSKGEDLPYFEKFKREVCKNQKSIALIDYMSEVDAEVDIFKHFNIDRVAELGFLGVLPTHRRRGIGLELITFSLDFLRTKSVAPVTSMIGTSMYTQRIGKKLGFQILAEFPFQKGDASDEVFQEVTRFHDRSTLLAKQL